MSSKHNGHAIEVLTCSATDLLRGHLNIAGSANPTAAPLNIPEYQRPYCWQDQQLEQLLADIKAHNTNEKTGGLAYYLGSLILHYDGSQLNIIDGQQRVTTMALLAYTLGQVSDISLTFDSPLSQQQIKHNFSWLRSRVGALKDSINLNNLTFTLVITRSLDDAYLFFETQNTGGVRLSGPDIIKAHHLRAVSTTLQPQFAKSWEGLGKLDDVVLALLKGRFWQYLHPRELPPHQQIRPLRDTIVSEFAQQTGDGPDIAYGRFRRECHVDGGSQLVFSQQGYELRQPLNAGRNTIHYLAMFQALYHKYWSKPDLPHLAGYQHFIGWLKNQQGCGYLQGLFEACLLSYISQFGEQQLEVAAKKLFRVVYSRRVSNQKAVRELTVPAFVREQPVLDWIAMSYTPVQCFQRLDAFSLVVDPSNLNTNSTKKRFVDSVVKYFQLAITPEQYATQFAPKLTAAIKELPL